MADAIRTYWLLAWTWTRAAAQYPVSLALVGLATGAVFCLDLAAIAVMFLRATRIAGFGAAEVMFFWCTAGLSFVASDILLGNSETIDVHVRKGTLDAILVRPVSPLIQLATEDYSPRRFAKLVPPVVVLCLIVPRLGVAWTVTKVLLLPLMVLSGVALFGALWVLSAAVQFVLVESHAATKSVTYGGSFIVQYPMTVFGREFVRVLTFVVPLAFVNWEPSLYILGRPDPLGLPAVFRFASPAVAAVLWAVAIPAWRAGLRHYRSTGS